MHGTIKVSFKVSIKVFSTTRARLKALSCARATTTSQGNTKYKPSARVGKAILAYTRVCWPQMALAGVYLPRASGVYENKAEQQDWPRRETASAHGSLWNVSVGLVK